MIFSKTKMVLETSKFFLCMSRHKCVVLKRLLKKKKKKKRNYTIKINVKVIDQSQHEDSHAGSSKWILLDEHR